MPPVSQAQRGAMAAAAGGNSTLGIPKNVGKEFMDADKGGKLPARKTKSARDRYSQKTVRSGKGEKGSKSPAPTPGL